MSFSFADEFTTEQLAVLRRLEPLLAGRGIPFHYGRRPRDLRFGSFGWTGRELWMDVGTFWFDAYHEFAHWLIAPPEARGNPAFDDNDWTEPDASALGVYLHAVVGEDFEGAISHAMEHDWGVSDDDAFEAVTRHLFDMVVGSDFYRELLSSLGWSA